MYTGRPSESNQEGSTGRQRFIRKKNYREIRPQIKWIDTIYNLQNTINDFNEPETYETPSDPKFKPKSSLTDLPHKRYI